MREIKFRAWDKEFNRYESDTIHMSLDMEGRVYNLQTGDGSDRYLLEQYTGLKDKNGVEIYEGDVVKYRLDGMTEIREDVRHVKYIKDAFECVLNKYADPMPIRWAFEIEVIGNIHENPKLLRAEP